MTKVGVWSVVSGQRIIRPLVLWHCELQALCEQYFGTVLSYAHGRRQPICIFTAE
jgi:hypothetical protein